MGVRSKWCWIRGLKKCREAKEEWLNKECKETEKAKYISAEGMHKRSKH